MINNNDDNTLRNTLDARPKNRTTDKTNHGNPERTTTTGRRHNNDSNNMECYPLDRASTRPLFFLPGITGPPRWLKEDDQDSSSCHDLNTSNHDRSVDYTDSSTEEGTIGAHSAPAIQMAMYPILEGAPHHILLNSKSLRSAQQLLWQEPRKPNNSSSSKRRTKNKRGKKKKQSSSSNSNNNDKKRGTTTTSKEQDLLTAAYEDQFKRRYASGRQLARLKRKNSGRRRRTAAVAPEMRMIVSFDEAQQMQSSSLYNDPFTRISLGNKQDAALEFRQESTTASSSPAIPFPFPGTPRPRTTATLGNFLQTSPTSRVQRTLSEFLKRNLNEEMIERREY
eukprot:CAMPEP_0116565558 /NCGR_PEP_ID=MMETSP0397-20121206/13965_1 /TAXON_ID=216820 /ORGANISM="Cyclophora tenuis, Strain ECT3854" /LENGTH=336 /DNA_ID=CAMNT_0004092345 /DNA_START=69 /DNA_END=1079 /DNA_ORIENTATION=-